VDFPDHRFRLVERVASELNNTVIADVDAVVPIPGSPLHFEMIPGPEPAALGPSMFVHLSLKS